MLSSVSQVEIVGVEIFKRSSDSMDLGATLAVILGSAAVGAVAKGISEWLSKRQDAEIIVTSPDRSFEAKHITSADLSKLSKC